MAELDWRHPGLEVLVRGELARILSSRDFYASRRFSDFLTYLVEETLAGRGPELKAYNIGVEVFRRPADFDPQSDSVVRVEAAKLRSRLENYYRHNSPSGVEIMVPKGHYSVIFRRAPGTEAAGQPEEAAMINEFPVAGELPHADEKQSGAAGSFSSVQTKACSIAVFPFLNIGGGQQVTHLVSGIVEELIIGLTRFHDLIVINANFSPEAQSGNADMAALTRQLGARFYLYGNIQVLDSSMRIRAILVDSQSRRSIWAEKFDSAFAPANLFDTIDEIIGRVLSGIAGSFGTISRTLFNNLTNERGWGNAGEFAAYEAVMHYHNWVGGLDSEAAPKTRAALERAVLVDPGYSLARSMLADFYAVNSQWASSHAEGEWLEAQSLELALEAEKLNPRCQYAQWAKAFNAFLRHESGAFLENARIAVELNPANPNIINGVGLKLAVFGRYEEGMSLVNSAIRLNPFLPRWFLLAPFLAEYMQGNYEAALKISMQMFLPGYPVASLIRAATFGKMKRIEEAEREITEILRVFPAFSAVGRRTIAKVFYHEHQSEAIAEGLNVAGLKI